MKFLNSKKIISLGVLVLFGIASVYFLSSIDFDKSVFKADSFILFSDSEIVNNDEQGEIKFGEFLNDNIVEEGDFEALVLPYSEDFIDDSFDYLGGVDFDNLYVIYNEDEGFFLEQKRLLTSQNIRVIFDEKYHTFLDGILSRYSDKNVYVLSSSSGLIFPDDSLVVLLKEGSNHSDENVRIFQNSYLEDVLENVDVDANTSNDVKVFLEILEDRDFEVLENRLELNSDEFDTFILDYEDGEISVDRDIYLMAFGDMMLGRYVRTLMDKNGHDYIFERIHSDEMPLFVNSDIIFGNLEGPIKGDGYKSSTAMVFGFPEYVAPLLKKYNFSLVSLANNHAVDQGWDGRDTTIAALDNVGISWCGHPSEADPESVYYTEISGKKLAFVCLHDVTFKLDTESANELIKEVSEEVDFLIVSPHWGVEYQNTMNQKWVDMAHDWVDNGADLIIGTHPHVVQNFELYNGKYIFYSLGNFVFDQYWSQGTQEELALLVKISDDNVAVTLLPMKSEKSQSFLMEGDVRENWVERFIRYGTYDEMMKAQIRDFKLNSKNAIIN